MRLNAHDEIRIDGLHPRHPITDVVIPGVLQSFAVTRDQDGDYLDPGVLHPHCDEQAPIAMARVRWVNMQRVTHQ